MPATELDAISTLTSREKMQEILRGLMSPHTDTRLEAQAQLTAIGPAAVDYLLAEAEDQTVRWMQRKRRYKWIAGTYLSVAIPGILACIGCAVYFTLHGNPNAIGGFIGGGVGGLGGGLGGGILGGFSPLLIPPPELIAISNALLAFDDPKVVGALTAGLSVPDPKLRSAVQDKLIKLLPQASAEDLMEVSAPQRQQLRKLLSLNPEHDSQLMIAVLGALERMGDTAAFSEARRLEKFAGKPEVNEKVILVRRAAQQCARVLAALLVQGSDSLLRASDNPAPEGEDLLRPAGFSGKGDHGSLLRPSMDETQELEPVQPSSEEARVQVSNT